MNKKLLFLPAAALALAAPAVAQKVDQQLSINAEPKTVTFGKTLKISGKLTGGTARDVSGQNVTVLRDPFPYDAKYDRVASGDTDDAGNYSFTVPAASNARYKTTAKANTESALVTVPVRVRVTRRVSDRTPRKGQRVKFRGQVAPAHDGKVARIQRRTSSGWKNIAKVKLADGGDAVSVYSKRVRITRSGRYRVRFSPNDGDHVAGNSRKVRLRVG